MTAFASILMLGTLLQGPENEVAERAEEPADIAITPTEIGGGFTYLNRDKDAIYQLLLEMHEAEIASIETQRAATSKRIETGDERSRTRDRGVLRKLEQRLKVLRRTTPTPKTPINEKVVQRVSRSLSSLKVGESGFIGTSGAATVEVRQLMEGQAFLGVISGDKEYKPYVFRGLDTSRLSTGEHVELIGLFSATGTHTYKNTAGSTTTAIVVEPYRVTREPETAAANPEVGAAGD